MPDQPPNDLVPVNASAAPPSDLSPVTPAEPAAEPQHARWDVIGSISRAWQGAKGQLSADASEFVDPKNRDVAAGAHAGERLPLDVANLGLAPAGAFIHSTLGSAMSYPMEALDKLNGVTPEMYNKKKTVKGLFGMPFDVTLKDPQRAGEDVSDIMTGGAALPARGLGLTAEIAAARPAVEAARAQKPVDAAARAVAKRAEQDKITPDAWEDAKAKAAQNGDKFSLMDMGKNLRNLGGKVFRGPGEGSSILDTFLKTRDKEVGPALDAEIQKIAKGSTYDAINHLFGERSQAGGPLFKQAFERGSTAPFETMYQQHFAEAGKAEQEAAQRVQQARNAQTVLEGKSATNSNIYSTPTPAAKAEAHQAVNEAQAQLEAIQAQKQRTLELLKKAQADGTANAPGAVWSPRLQELMADPDIQSGIKRGLKIEKKNALAEGRPFEDRDYAIVGWEEAIDPDTGRKTMDPIVGSVPTMRMLAAGKEGMDAIVLDQVHEIGHTSAGRPTKEGFANRKIRDEFRKELVTLNPIYGKAIEAWSGPSESIDAVRQGKEHFTRDDSIEQVQAEFNDMTEANKEFYRLGAAEHLINKNKSVAIAGDESKAILNSRKDEERLRLLFKDPKEADQFMEQVMRKRQMFETKQKVAGGSDTAERIAEDRSRLATAGQHFLTAGERGLRGHPLTAAREAWRGGQAIFRNPARNEQIAKIFADPNASLPVPKGPRRPRTLQQLIADARSAEDTQ